MTVSLAAWLLLPAGAQEATDAPPAGPSLEVVWRAQRERPPPPLPVAHPELGWTRVEVRGPWRGTGWQVHDPAGRALTTGAFLVGVGAERELRRYRLNQGKDLALAVAGVGGGAALAVVGFSTFGGSDPASRNDSALPLLMGQAGLAAVGVGLAAAVIHEVRRRPSGFLSAAEVDAWIGDRSSDAPADGRAPTGR